MLGIFLDSETTGLDPQKHRVLEIGIKVIDLLTGDNSASLEHTLFQSNAVWKECDPHSLKVNGFSEAVSMFLQTQLCRRVSRLRAQYL